jgi:regulator of ribonuclease activity A
MTSSEGPREFSTADLHDAQPDDVEVLDLQFRCFGRHACFSGPIETLRVYEDHSPVRDIVATDGHGRVLVVDAGGSLRVGVLGDRIASRAVQSAWAGVVVIGAIRDSVAVDRLEIGVRALGTTARRSNVERPGEHGLMLRIGGIKCGPGEWLYADRDAVLVSKRMLMFPSAKT